MKINANDYSDYRNLNSAVKDCKDKNITIENCMGQRYIGCALNNKTININGTPGNALGAYLDGAKINVYGNGQDAVADTMNDGKIVIHGNCGDAVGYGMRGGKIFIKGNAGYRAGIHMKAYKNKYPVMIIGGSAGSFLAEYQAGGLIIVLGLNKEKEKVGHMCCTGMHGGKVIIRSDNLPKGLSHQVKSNVVDFNICKTEKALIQEFCEEFNLDENMVFNHKFIELIPDSEHPYRQLYTNN